MSEPSVYTVVREILTGDIKLASDVVISQAKAKGVASSESEIRKVVHWTRSSLKKQSRKRRRKSSGALSAYTVAREVLTTDPGLSNDAVLDRIKTRGVTGSDATIREAIRTTRGKLRRAGAIVAPAAARLTVEPKVQAAPPDESSLFASISQVNKAAHLCGGVAKARDIAEAIRACGGLDVFVKRLDIVAEILSSDTEM